MINKIVIKRIAEELNNLDIVWGVGGSYLLNIYELIDNPNDLDLWVNPSDMETVRNYFFKYQEIETDIPLPPELHYKILYNNLEVDFVACFKIKPNQYEFEYNIKPQNVKLVRLHNGVELPCTYLEDWYIVYKLLKREDKAKLIEDFFSRNKLDFSTDVIQSYLYNDNVKLPKYITSNVQKLVQEATQLTFFDC